MVGVLENANCVIGSATKSAVACPRHNPGNAVPLQLYDAFLVRKFKPPIQIFDPSIQIWNCLFQTFDPSIKTPFSSIQTLDPSNQTLDPSNQTFHPSIQTCITS